ncbi:hypothetical protein HJC23_003803 [Cyclotella cryptica]|uniref:Selenoprotein F/M domain-containing protein n=1 Tax=Cyclotella cryptica TaxID=29204 RepID=A0ABD3PZE4_9STRA|eukprot:CCRYP_009955-RA/>CCRYP_009955-RA protein AED:0.04 eAED:0.04 QI:0/-1/0/1/-1/1/1/0/224
MAMAPPKLTTVLIATLALTFHLSQLFAFASTLTEESCLTRGFDPYNLSCETCHLLEESTTLSSLVQEYNAKHSKEPIDIVQECRYCCQSHKFNPVLHHGQSLRGKFRYALLTYNEGSLDQYGEIKDFVDKDLNDVLSFKGEHRFRVSVSEKIGLDGNMMQMMMMMGGGFRGFGGPPKLMLFENAKKGGGKWSEDDENEAGEVITLRGWKREDLKDMLMTLLPNA